MGPFYSSYLVSHIRVVEMGPTFCEICRPVGIELTRKSESAIISCGLASFLLCFLQELFGAMLV